MPNTPVKAAAEGLPIHPAIIKASLSAKGAEAEGRAAAEYLRDAMQRIHGGEWRVNINHERRLVMVWCLDYTAPITPKQGVA